VHVRLPGEPERVRGEEPAERRGVHLLHPDPSRCTCGRGTRTPDGVFSGMNRLMHPFDNG
jgi:hypothetical protein